MVSSYNSVLIRIPSQLQAHIANYAINGKLSQEEAVVKLLTLGLGHGEITSETPVTSAMIPLHRRAVDALIFISIRPAGRRDLGVFLNTPYATTCGVLRWLEDKGLIKTSQEVRETAGRPAELFELTEYGRLHADREMGKSAPTTPAGK